jgi:hypothetical protein
LLNQDFKFRVFMCLYAFLRFLRSTTPVPHTHAATTKVRPVYVEADVASPVEGILAEELVLAGS